MSTVISSTLGFLTLEGSGNSSISQTASMVVSEAAEMAESVWAAQFKDTPADTLTSTSGYTAAVTDRQKDATYYYALDSVAAALISYKVGNIGAQQNSKVSALLVQKAQGLQAIARAGVQRYLEWVKSEASVRGANITGKIIGGTGIDSKDGVLGEIQGHAATGIDEAKSFYALTAADFAPAGQAYVLDPLSSHWINIVAYGGIGYALKNVGGEMSARAPTYSDMMNPAVSAYYQKMGNSLTELGNQIIAIYEQYVTAQKIQQAVYLAEV